MRQLGHRVTVTADYADEPADTMVAIHAWRSAEAIARFKTRHPKRWLILQLSGTDIYEHLTKDARPTLRSMELADRLVALNSLAWRVVPERFRKKLRVIFQSAPKPAAPRRPSERSIDVCVIGYLRDVKIPKGRHRQRGCCPPRPEFASFTSAALTIPNGQPAATTEMAENPRYLWREEVPRAAVQKVLLRSHAMVLSSLSEGGANVISEAVMAGVPILASRADGNVGLLGTDYPGYCACDTQALARLLQRIETDRSFVDQLRRASARLAPLFSPEREVAAWERLLAELSPNADRRLPRGGA